MPISMCERSAKGTSLVTSSHSNTAKLHMSADRRLMSSGFFCKAGKIEVDWQKVCLSSECRQHTLLFNTKQCRVCIISYRERGTIPKEVDKRGFRMVGLSGTFRGHPCWRIHASGTLEGELSVGHADSSSHVLINLKQTKK